MGEHNKPSWVVWGSAFTLLALPVLYFLSMGPISVLKRNLSPEALGVVHCYELPFAWSYWNGPEWWREIVDGYCNLWR